MTDNNHAAPLWIQLEDSSDQLNLFSACPVCFLSVIGPSSSSTGPKCNVMVISWLIAAGGDCLVMSMNKRRHTSTMLNSGSPVCLSIIGSHNEELALNVGSVSGRWGKSKFPQDYSNDKDQQTKTRDSNNDKTYASRGDQARMSKRAKKRQRFEMGIPGLRREKQGKEGKEAETFAIEGTLAHIHCQVVSKEESIIDDEHYFVRVAMLRAFVRTAHWDPDTKIFAPKSLEHSSTSSFLGSQSFGYVVRNPPTIDNAKLPVHSKLPQQNSALKCTGNHPKEAESAWIQLDDGKQFSRLLYPNPLCLLVFNGHEDRDKEGAANTVVLERVTATNNTGSFMFCIPTQANIKASSVRVGMQVVLDGASCCQCQFRGWKV
ncbi:Flavin reductase like domain [Seminavis robusta]|uniref:Flavin reductase like domain n=1 Tax=Seminavis robusta TaxID=568900 RepID=A0A9N8HAR6_9STRA|nr:Flavin reductase like domain [Seminavis robusta]|eukprot:Sro235_g094730.1 Flavin reductase like domain (375) ;mRNA; r:46302-47426